MSRMCIDPSLLLAAWPVSFGDCHESASTCQDEIALIGALTRPARVVIARILARRRRTHMRRTLALLVTLFGFAPPARAYVDCALSLGRIVSDATSIYVVRVDKVSAEKQAILFKPVAQIKGTETSDEVKHLIQRGFH